MVSASNRPSVSSYKNVVVIADFLKVAVVHRSYVKSEKYAHPEIFLLEEFRDFPKLICNYKRVCFEPNADHD